MAFFSGGGDDAVSQNRSFFVIGIAVDGGTVPPVFGAFGEKNPLVPIGRSVHRELADRDFFIQTGVDEQLHALGFDRLAEPDFKGGAVLFHALGRIEGIVITVIADKHLYFGGQNGAVSGGKIGGDPGDICHEAEIILHIEMRLFSFKQIQRMMVPAPVVD